MSNVVGMVEPLGDGTGADLRSLRRGFDSLHVVRHTVPDQAVYLGRRFRRDDGLEGFFYFVAARTVQSRIACAYQLLDQLAKLLVLLPTTSAAADLHRVLPFTFRVS